MEEHIPAENLVILARRKEYAAYTVPAFEQMQEVAEEVINDSNGLSEDLKGQIRKILKEFDLQEFVKRVSSDGFFDEDSSQRKEDVVVDALFQTLVNEGWSLHTESLGLKYKLKVPEEGKESLNRFYQAFGKKLLEKGITRKMWRP